MPVQVFCIQCANPFSVLPARQSKAKFCSYACRGKWRTEHWSGENNPLWTGGERVKTCKCCGESFSIKKGQPITTFKVQKYCSKECAWKMQDITGSNNPNWKGGIKKNRGPKHDAWAQAVITRDNATCKHCGAKGVELHAHHILPYKTHPKLRLDLDNGLTLCCFCHWKVHSAATANGVNSGNPQRKDGGNPEPSLNGNILEGVTTNGRVYRRWNGHCAWCGEFISKRLSDATNRKNNFCGRHCATKHLAHVRFGIPKPPTTVIPTRAPCPKGMI